MTSVLTKPVASAVDRLAPLRLVDAPRGADVLVASVQACAQRRRLAELGIRPGARVRPLTRNAGGGCTLMIGTSRIALDKAVLELVLVTPA